MKAKDILYIIIGLCILMVTCMYCYTTYVEAHALIEQVTFDSIENSKDASNIDFNIFTSVATGVVVATITVIIMLVLFAYSIMNAFLK